MSKENTSEVKDTGLEQLNEILNSGYKAIRVVSKTDLEKKYDFVTIGIMPEGQSKNKEEDDLVRTAFLLCYKRNKDEWFNQELVFPELCAIIGRQLENLGYQVKYPLGLARQLKGTLQLLGFENFKRGKTGTMVLIDIPLIDLLKKDEKNSLRAIREIHEEGS